MKDMNACITAAVASGPFLNLFHYEISYNGTDWRTHGTSKDLFVMDVVVFEVVVIENTF